MDSPTPIPYETPLTYGTAADLFVPIYFSLSIVLTAAIFFVVYAIIVRPWLRSR